jgi:hypothetical protein
MVSRYQVEPGLDDLQLTMPDGTRHRLPTVRTAED